MRPLGLMLIAAAFILPAMWFSDLAARHDQAALFSQFLGACALIAMGISQLLATRLSGLEFVFGGLDRIYVLHKWLGIAALALVVLHDTIDAEMDGLGAETTITEIAESLGEISLYGLLILGTVSVLTFVPYHLWKHTHKFMGGFFAASALHFAFIQKPFANGDPLGLYVLAFCGLGVAAYLYSLIPSGTFRGWRPYSIANLERTGGALAVTLQPDGRPIRHRAGQFAFVQFTQPGLTEVHPFTISKAADSAGLLRFTIKELGDFTGQLDQALEPHALEPGASVRVSGPFGHFRSRPDSQPQVWIASGVGITPFMAWAQALPETGGPVHLFYSARTRAGAPHLDELEAIAHEKPNLHLHFVDTQHEARLTARRILDACGETPAHLHVAFCGPEPMRRSLMRQFSDAGLPSRRFRFEAFEIRSGLGIRRLVARLLDSRG